MRRTLALVTALACGCGPQSPPEHPSPSASGERPLPSPAAISDSGAANLIPAGYGTRRREDIAIKLQPESVLVSFTPLDESVTRVLASDSYRYLHDIFESRRAELARAAQQNGLRRGSVWYAELTGLTPDARYDP